MRYLTPKETKDNLVHQFSIFRDKHNWVMTWLYTMIFGSFLIPKIFATRIQAGTPQYALYGFSVYYLVPRYLLKSCSNAR